MSYQVASMTCTSDAGSFVGKCVVDPAGNILPGKRIGGCGIKSSDGRTVVECYSAPLTKKQLSRLLSILRELDGKGEFEFRYYSRNKLLFSCTFDRKKELENFIVNMMEDIVFKGIEITKHGKIILRTTAKNWEQLLEELEEQGFAYVVTDTGWSYLLDLNTGFVIPTADYGINYLEKALEKGQVEIPWYGEIEDYLETGYKEFLVFMDELKVPEERKKKIEKLARKLNERR